MAFWQIITGDNNQLLDSEKTIMEFATPLQDIDTCVLQACNFVRGYLTAGPLEPAPRVPPEVVDDTIAIARYNYLAQEPTGTLLTDIRRTAYDHAVAHLRDIANDKSSYTAADPTTLPPTEVLFGKFGSETKIPMRTSTLP